jgi:hypothetical protein
VRAGRGRSIAAPAAAGWHHAEPRPRSNSGQEAGRPARKMEKNSGRLLITAPGEEGPEFPPGASPLASRHPVAARTETRPPEAGSLSPGRGTPWRRPLLGAARRRPAYFAYFAPLWVGEVWALGCEVWSPAAGPRRSGRWPPTPDAPRRHRALVRSAWRGYRAPGEGPVRDSGGRGAGRTASEMPTHRDVRPHALHVLHDLQVLRS